MHALMQTTSCICSVHYLLLSNSQMQEASLQEGWFCLFVFLFLQRCAKPWRLLLQLTSSEGNTTSSNLFLEHQLSHISAGRHTAISSSFAELLQQPTAPAPICSLKAARPYTHFPALSCFKKPSFSFAKISSSRACFWRLCCCCVLFYLTPIIKTG